MDHFNSEEEKIKQKDKSKKINTVKTVILIIMLFGTVGISFFLGNYMGSKGKFFIGNTNTTSKLKGIDNVEGYEKLFLVRDIIYKNFDGDINEENLINGAIKGMTMGLEDPYTVFMEADKYKEFNEKNSGSYLGIGIEMITENDEIRVEKIFEGGPAADSKIKVGDTILKVNGESIGSDTKKAMELIQGEKGTEVTIELKNSTETYEVTLVRNIIKKDAVESEMLDNAVGYISISGFESEVSKSFKSHLEQLKSQGMKGLILDLRDNTGGYLDESIKIASEFIPKGETIVSTIDKYENKNRYVSIGGIAEGTPMVLLVNGNSASASEVVAGALRDFNVATLVGTKTYGKGVVQDVLNKDNSELKDGSALKVTTAKYYTPNGENIHKKGIEPKIVVEYPEELKGKKYDRSKDPQFDKALETINDIMK